MLRVVTPAQTIVDLLSAIPNALDCCGKGTMPVSFRIIDSLRVAANDATAEEENTYRLLARCRHVVRQHLIRCQVQADVDAATDGKAHARSEEALQSARELLASIEARLGVNDD